MSFLRLACIYLGAGAISGIISGSLSEVKPLGLIIPGPSFGIAFVVASKVAERPIRWAWLFICLAGLAFIATDFVFLLSLGFVDEISGGNALAGGFCGFAGASILSLHSEVEGVFDWVQFAVVTAVGGLLGAFVLPVAIQFNDSPSIGSPLSFIFLLGSWQAGMMLAMGLFRHRVAVSAFSDET